jgi:hypothetical protein
MNHPEDYDNEEEDDNYDALEPATVSEEDVRREEEELRELEEKKRGLEDRVSDMEKDLGGLLR